MKRFILLVALLMPLLAYAEESAKDTRESLKLKLTAIEWEARYCQERLQNLDVQYKVLLEEYKVLAGKPTPQQNEAK